MNVCDVERMARRRMDVLLFVSLLRVSEFWSVMKCAFGHRTQKNSAQKISCWKQGCSRHAKFKQVIKHFCSTLVCDKLHTRLWHLQINFLEQTHVCLGYFFRNQGTHVTMWLTLPGCAQHIILCNSCFGFFKAYDEFKHRKNPGVYGLPDIDDACQHWAAKIKCRGVRISSTTYQTSGPDLPSKLYQNRHTPQIVKETRKKLKTCQKRLKSRPSRPLEW